MSVPNGFVACRDCPLRKLSAFTAYTDAEIEFVQSFKKAEIHVEEGGEVLAEGGPVRELYTLLKGIAFRFRTLSDGRRQILNFLFPGDLIGMQEKVSSESPHGVETLTAARFCVFPVEKLWDLYRQYPQLGYDVTWLTAHEEHIVDDNLLSVGRRNASERLAMLLIHFVKRAEGVGLSVDGSVPFPVTQQHIADALGLSLVHTNKTLRRLEKLGLHKIENDRLRLIKPAALKRMADYYGAPPRIRPLI